MGNNHLALFAGLTALFTNLAAVNVVALIGNTGSTAQQVGVAFFTAIAAAGAVFFKQKRDDAKALRDRQADPPKPS